MTSKEAQVAAVGGEMLVISYLYYLVNLEDERALTKIYADKLASFLDTHDWV